MLEQQAATLGQQARLLELTQEAIFVRDINNALVYWNQGAESMYGWTKEEAVGNVTHTFLQAQFPSSYEAVETILLQSGRWEGELTHTKKDGTQIFVESRQVLVLSQQGEPIGFLEVNRDISERKQLESALRSSEAIARKRLAELESIYATAPVGLCFQDAEFKYVL